MPIPAVTLGGFTGASGTGNIVCSIPGTEGVDWNAGDVFLLYVESADEAVATPSGWTIVTGSPQSCTALTRLSVFWRRAVTGDTQVTVTDPGDHATGVVIAVTGCIASGNPWDVTNGDIKLVPSTSLSATGNTTTVANCLVIIAATTDTDTGTPRWSAWANADLANVTEIYDISTTQGNGGGIGITTGEKAVAGAFGATTATIAASASNAYFIVALKPAVATPPTLVSATWQSDGVTLRTVWSATVTVVGTPTFSIAARSIANAVMVYKSGTGTNTIDWTPNSWPNHPVFGDTVTMSAAAGTVKDVATSTDQATITNNAATNNTTATAAIVFKGAPTAAPRIYVTYFVGDGTGDADTGGLVNQMYDDPDNFLANNFGDPADGVDAWFTAGIENLCIIWWAGQVASGSEFKVGISSADGSDVAVTPRNEVNFTTLVGTGYFARLRAAIASRAQYIRDLKLFNGPVAFTSGTTNVVLDAHSAFSEEVNASRVIDSEASLDATPSPPQYLKDVRDVARGVASPMQETFSRKDITKPALWLPYISGGYTDAGSPALANPATYRQVVDYRALGKRAFVRIHANFGTVAQRQAEMTRLLLLGHDVGMDANGLTANEKLAVVAAGNTAIRVFLSRSSSRRSRERDR